LALKLIKNEEVNGNFAIQLDANIPESGDYIINLDLGDGMFKSIQVNNLKIGVHRITVKNISALSAKEIQIIKQ